MSVIVGLERRAEEQGAVYVGSTSIFVQSEMFCLQRQKRQSVKLLLIVAAAGGLKETLQ